jgi:hypothetical protein
MVCVPVRRVAGMPHACGLVNGEPLQWWGGQEGVVDAHGAAHKAKDTQLMCGIRVWYIVVVVSAMSSRALSFSPEHDGCHAGCAATGR